MSKLGLREANSLTVRQLIPQHSLEMNSHLWNVEECIILLLTYFLASQVKE